MIDDRYAFLSGHLANSDMVDALQRIDKFLLPARDALRHLEYAISPVEKALKDLERPEFEGLKQHLQQSDELKKAFDSHFAAYRNPVRLSELTAWNALPKIDHDRLFGLTTYKLPKLPEVSSLLPQMPDIGKLYGSQFNPGALGTAIERMQTPWADPGGLLASMKGFNRLQELGHAINALPPFQRDFTRALRRDLGDWRDPITWPADSDLIDQRQALYVDRGLELSLTHFPARAFAEGAELAGLGRIETAARTKPAEPEEEFSAGEEDEDTLRTESAFKQLRHLEIALRRFIDRVMTAAYGEQWPKHRLPPELYENWCDKKQKAESNGGAPHPLIFYADFTDYERVICRNDDWKTIFAPIFQRKESVRETFQRLHPVRIVTMHARIVTPDDAIFLMAESRRLLRAING